MKKKILIFLFFTITLLSSVLSTVDFDFCRYILPTTYIFLIGGLTIIGIYIYLYIKSPVILLYFGLLDFVILLWGLYLTTSFFLSPLYNRQTDALFFYWFAIILYFTTQSLVTIFDKNLISRLVLYSIQAIGIIQTFYALLQWINIMPNIFGFKFGGSFGNPGNLSNLIVVSYIISSGLFLLGNKMKVLYGILSLTQLTIIIASFSRTSWLACIISFFFLLTFKSRIKTRITRFNNNKNRLLKLCIVFCLIFFLIFSFDKAYDLKRASANGRLLIWGNCIKLIYEKPLFGHGYESLNGKYAKQQINYFASEKDNNSNKLLAGTPIFAFNDYLQYTVEYGSIMLIFFGVLIYCTFNINNSNKYLTIVKSALLAIYISMFTSYPLQNQTVNLSFYLLISSISIYSKKVMAIKIKRKIFYLIAAIVIVFNSYIIYDAVITLYYGKKWKNAFELSSKNPSKSSEQFISISPYLRKNKSFLYIQGLVFFKAKKYVECINHFENYKHLFISTDMYLMLGESYQQTEDYQNAEKNYLLASNLIPYLFIPKYKLFKLYIESNQLDNANRIASEIDTMKIKVYSKTVSNIKTEIRNYLRQNPIKDEK
ncbi:MAG: O-antigen ligase family protein [Prolixibacteraceae bacterium]